MSNYYKNSTVVRISDICKNITTNDISNNYYRNLGIPFGSTTFNSDINEKPANLGYKYNNIDISTYCIATYIESSVTTFTSVPTWCNKIRAILVGGGGSGGTGSIGTTHDTKIQNDGILYVRTQHWNQSLHGGQEDTIQTLTNTNNRYTNTNVQGVQVLNNRTIANLVWKNNTDNFSYLYGLRNYDATQHINHNNNDQYNYSAGRPDHERQDTIVSLSSKIQEEHYTVNIQVLGAGGAGGGGGAFLYLETTLNATNRNQITLNNVGASTHTSITISGTTYTALKGGAATNNTTEGSGGTVTGTVNISASGNAGVTTTTSTGGSGGLSGLSSYSTVLPTYGRGGDGGDAVVKGATANSGDDGKTGYYRIYYLTD